MKETKFKQTLVQTKEGSRHCEERSDVAIQSGFKMTEVGMIPSDWEVKTLGDIFDFSAGGDLQKECFSEYPSGTIKWPIYSNSLENKGLYGYTSNPRYRANCVTITGRGSLGHAEYRREAFDAIVRLLVLSPKQHVDCYFVSETINFRVPFVFESTGVPQLTAPQAAKSKISLPPTIEEQQRIANALSDVDTLIANLEKLIAKKKNIKQGAMQQLLTGRKRLPGFGSDERRKECHSERSAKREESSGYKMTELGLIPSDWEVKSFGELFDILPNNTLSRAELNEDSGSFKNVHYGDVLVKFPEWIDCSKNTLPFINSGAKFNHTALQDGDVIIADTAEDETVGKSTEIYNVGKMKIVSGLHTIPIRPKKKFASKWLGYFINSACWHDQILPFITGTKVSAISKTAIAETKFFYPAKIDEQTAIANVLSDMDTEISALETKLAKYRTLKTGMMQQLLTGKIRLI